MEDILNLYWKMLKNTAGVSFKPVSRTDDVTLILLLATGLKRMNDNLNNPSNILMKLISDSFGYYRVSSCIRAMISFKSFAATMDVIEPRSLYGLYSTISAPMIFPFRR